MRLLLLLLALLLPLGGLGFALFELPGLAGGSVFAVATLLGAAFTAERTVMAHLALRSQISRMHPRIWIFSDPAPQAIALRSLGGGGVILLSQGLVGLLSEEEKAEIIIKGRQSVASKSILLPSVCAALATWMLRVTPSDWMSIERRMENGLSAHSAIHFLIMAPLLRGLEFVGSTRTSRRKGERVNASHKIERIEKIWKSPFVPGISNLSILK